MIDISKKKLIRIIPVVILTLFIGLGVLGTFWLSINYNVKASYPSKEWLENYPSIWVGLSGDEKTLENRTQWIKELGDIINNKYPDYNARYIFKPEKSYYHSFLYPSLEDLKNEKDSIISIFQKSIRKDVTTIYDSLKVLNVVKDNNSKQPEYKEKTKAPDYATSYSYEYINSEFDKNIEQGQESKISFSIKNIGEEKWNKDEVFLITTKPYLHNSVFFDKNTWVSPSVILSLNKEVDINEKILLEFNIDSNVEPGTYSKEHLTLALFDKEKEEYVHIEGSSFYFSLKITPNSENINKDLDFIEQSTNTLLKILDEKDSTIDSRNLEKLYNFDLFKLENLEDETKSNITDNSKGYLVSKNKKMVLLEIRPETDITDIKNLKKFYTDIKKEIDNINTKKTKNNDGGEKKEYVDDVVVKFNKHSLDKFELTFSSAKSFLLDKLKDKNIEEVFSNEKTLEIRFSGDKNTLNIIKNTTLIVFNDTGIKFYASGTKVDKVKREGVLTLRDVASIRTVDTFSKILEDILKSKENKLILSGVPVHVFKELDKFKISPELLVLLFLLGSFFFTLVTSRFILPTITLYFSIIIGVIISLTTYLYIFDYMYFQDVFILPFILLFPIFLANLVLNKTIDLKILSANTSLGTLVNTVIKKEKKLFLYITFISSVAVSMILMLGNEFYFRIAFLALILFVFTFLVILYLFPSLIFFFRKYESSKNRSTISYLDFTFITEMFLLFRKYKYILITLFVLVVLGISSNAFSISTFFDMPTDKTTRGLEDKIKLSFNFNSIYPLHIISPTEESIHSINQFVSDSKIFVTDDNIFSHIPKNQEEKIGIIQSIFKDINTENILFDSKDLTKNDLTKLEDKLEKVSSVITSILDMKERKSYYPNIRKRDLVKTNESIKNILKILSSDDEKITEKNIKKINLINKELYTYTENILFSLEDAIKVKEPLTTKNFSPVDKHRYITEDNKFITFIYPFGSIFNKDHQRKIKNDIATLGYDIKEKNIFNSDYNVDDSTIYFMIGILLLIILVGSAILFDGWKYIAINSILMVTYVLVHQGLFNMYHLDYSFLGLLTSFFTLLMLNLSIITILNSFSKKSDIDETSTIYKSVIVSIIALISIMLFFAITHGMSIDMLGYKILLDIVLMIMFIVFVLPVLSIVFMEKELYFLHYLNTQSGIQSRSNLDKAMEKTSFANSKTGIKTILMSFFLLLKALKNQYNDYRRNKILNTLNNTGKGEPFFSFIKKSFHSFIKDFKNSLRGEDKSTSEEIHKAAKDLQEKDKNIYQLKKLKEEKIKADHIKKKRKIDNRKIETEEESTNDDKYDFGESKYIPIHVFETEDELTIEAEVGDVNIYDIDVSISENILRIKNSDMYHGTSFERHISIHAKINEKEIDMNIDDGELIISIPKLIEEVPSTSNENTTETEKPSTDKTGNKPKQIDDEKTAILKDLMNEDDSNGISLQPERHSIEKKKLDYEIHDSATEVKIIVHLNHLHIDNIQISLDDNILKIFEHDDYTGEPFNIDITLDDRLIHESITTEMENEKTLIIKGEYRPDVLTVKEIKEES